MCCLGGGEGGELMSGVAEVFVDTSPSFGLE